MSELFVKKLALSDTFVPQSSRVLGRPVTDYIQMYSITITITLLFHDYRLQLQLHLS